MSWFTLPPDVWTFTTVFSDVWCCSSHDVTIRFSSSPLFHWRFLPKIHSSPCNFFSPACSLFWGSVSSTSWFLLTAVLQTTQTLLSRSVHTAVFFSHSTTYSSTTRLARKFYHLQPTYLSRYSDWLRAGRSGIEFRWGRDFPPVYVALLQRELSILEHNSCLFASV